MDEVDRIRTDADDIPCARSAGHGDGV
jgi:hypothetical protein